MIRLRGRTLIDFPGIHVREDLGAPALAATDTIVANVAPTTGTQALTVQAQPDTPRNITVTLTDANSSITGGTCTVVGLDPQGRAVTEVLNFASAKTLTGTKIFKSVTSATVAGITGTITGGSADMIKVGCGNVIGLANDIVNTSAVKHVQFANARIASPTLAAGKSTSGVDVSGSTYDGSKRLSVIYQPGG